MFLVSSILSGLFLTDTFACEYFMIMNIKCRYLSPNTKNLEILPARKSFLWRKWLINDLNW